MKGEEWVRWWLCRDGGEMVQACGRGGGWECDAMVVSEAVIFGSGWW